LWFVSSRIFDSSLTPPQSDDGLAAPDSDDENAIKGIEDVSINDASAMASAVAATATYIASNPDAAAGAIVEKVKNEQMASALKSFDKIHVLLRACITPNFFKTGDVGKHATAIKIIINNNADLQRWAISSCEWLCREASTTSFPLLLKLMYDEDILDEEVLLLWAGSADTRDSFVDKEVTEERRKELHESAKQFIEWLEEAESESDDEEN